jgi:long-chain acyl-CoA synthetase
MIENAMLAPTIPARLFALANSRPSATAYYVKSGGRWVPTSYQAYAADVKQTGKAFIALGMQPGSTVSILGFNRPEWVVFDVACMSIGGAPAGIYTTCSPDEVQYIIHHAESPVVLVEDAAQWEKVHKVLDRLPLLKRVVLMKGAPTVDHPLVMTWDQFLATGKDVSDEAFHARLEALKPADLATLIYTSGTTGPPKGVMLSHENLAWTADVSRGLVDGQASDVVLSYLPLSHIAEQSFTIHGAITFGSTVYFAESIEKVPDNIKEVQPTIFFGVPRIWEKFHAGISAKLGEAKGAKRAIASWARKVGSQASKLRHTGQEPAGLLGLQYRLASKLVFSKLKPAIGLGRARACVSGAAPIDKEVLEFFASLDITVHEVYGQSEDSGPTSFNQRGRTKLGSVGTALPGVDVKIADDGEILVRGKNVFLGYYKEPAATAEALQDGWLHSGDLGQFDEEGFLFITGRKKEIIITAGGKNIAPKNIEGALKNHPLIGDAVVIGDRRKYLTALITLDPEAAGRYVKERGGGTEAAHEHPAVKEAVERAVHEVNETLARVESVKKFRILPRPFSIEAGELTPTLKLKRRVVHEHFAGEIEAMYSE